MFSAGTSATEHCLRKDMELGRSPDCYNGNKSQNNSSMVMYTTALQTLGMRWARYGCECARWCECLKGLKRLLWKTIFNFIFIFLF